MGGTSKRHRGSTAPLKREAIDALRYGPSTLSHWRATTRDQLTETLGRDGWAAPCEIEADGGWELGPACGAVLALSVGREELRSALAGPDGRLLAEEVKQLYVEPPKGKRQDGPKEFQAALATQLKSCVAGDHPPIVAVGVAWPGRIDRNADGGKGDPHKRSYHGKWEGLDGFLSELVHKAMATAGLKSDIPVYVVNDADADLMALAHSTREDHAKYPGEEEYPGLAEIREMIDKSRVTLSVTIAGGVGGALMFAPDSSQRRTVQRGSHGFAGEMGQIPVDVTRQDAEKATVIKGLSRLKQLKRDKAFPKWDCLYRETLDHYASGRSIVEQLYEKLEGGYNGRIRDLEARLARGDGDAPLEHVMDRSGRLIGQALVGPTLTLDPDLVVISSFAESKDLLEGVRHVLRQTSAGHIGLERKRIILAPTDPARILKGAARWAIEERIAPSLEKVCRASNDRLGKLRDELLEDAISA